MIAITNGITTRIPGMTAANAMSIATDETCVHEDHGHDGA
jgi:hypothetical protein